jgi:ABC-2 type transport system permease protein
VTGSAPGGAAAPAGPVPTPAASAAAAGSIYDLGYRGYDGPRFGRLTVGLALLGQTLREAFGIGRGGRAKIAPFLLMILNVLPALLAVGFTALARQSGAGDLLETANPIRHEAYWSITSTLVMLFCAAQAPELFGRDLRYGVLPLYFSRVLTRIDYGLARTGGLFIAILIVTLTPQLVLTIGGILAAADPAAGVGEEQPEIPRYLIVTVLGSAVFAGISAVVASYTPRRAYSVATIIGVFLIPPIVVGIIAALSVPDVARVLLLASPSDVVDGVNGAIYGPLRIGDESIVLATLDGWVYVVAALVFVVSSLAIVVRRYVTVTV